MHKWMMAVSGLVLSACGGAPSPEHAEFLATNEAAFTNYSRTECGTGDACSASEYKVQYNREYYYNNTCANTPVGQVNIHACSPIPYYSNENRYYGFSGCGIDTNYGKTMVSANYYTGSYDFKESCSLTYPATRGTGDNNYTKYEAIPASGNFVHCGSTCPASKTFVNTTYEAGCRVNPSATQSTPPAHNAVTCSA